MSDDRQRDGYPLKQEPAALQPMRRPGVASLDGYTWLTGAHGIDRSP